MPMTATRITVRHDDKNFGPYGVDDVQRMLAEGRLSPNDLAWVEGTPDWVRLGNVPGLMAVPPLPGSPRATMHGEPVSDRLVLPAFLLAFFLGVFGVHRFYVGKTGSGIVMLLLTVTLVGTIVTAIWATVDWILIVCGAFRDAAGRRLTVWT